MHTMEMQKARPMAGSGALDGRFRRLPHRGHVEPVRLNRRDPSPRARSFKSPPVIFSEGVAIDHPSSLQTNKTGRFQAEAKFMDSINIPWFMDPSPKKATAMEPGRKWFAARANPAAVGPAAPTMPEETAKYSLENRCMCPPIPPPSPSGQPSSSRIIKTGSKPRMSHRVAFAQLRNDAGNNRLFASAEMHFS
jgi:hypothetical protein